MGYKLLIKGPKMGVMALQHAELDEAMTAAQTAMEAGYLRYNKVLVWLEPGACLNVLSDEEASRSDVENVNAARSGGLIGTSHHAALSVKEDGFVMHIQLGGQSLPPYWYETEAQYEAALDHVLEHKRLQWSFKEGHDHLFIMLGPGVAIYKLTVAEYGKLRRDAVEAQQRAAAQQLGRKSSIILPGRQ